MKLKIALPLAFFAFIIYVIYLADSANYNFAFRVVGNIAYGDKIAHALLYGFLAYLLNYSLGYKRVFAFSIAAVVVFTFASIEEISQIWIDSRTFDFFDLLADLIGVLLFTNFQRRVYERSNKEYS